MNALKIVLGTTLSAICLGICMDLVTAHVAVEYFTVHHPKLVESKEPLVMAFVWGFVASWWFGAIAGILLATTHASLLGRVAVKRILSLVGKSCIILWLLAMLALGLSYLLFEGIVPMADRRLMAVAVAHWTVYMFGGIAVLWVIVKLVREAKHTPAN